MIDPDYRIEALDVLLDRDCLMERYFPLIPYRDALIRGLRRLGCVTKNDAAALPDGCFSEMGLQDGAQIALLRRFFTPYDPKPAKFRELDALSADPAETAVLREFYFLPGVRFIRADLYYRAGYRSLRELALSSPEEVRRRTAEAIHRDGLSCIVPLPKEARTHIAVAGAFTGEYGLADISKQPASGTAETGNGGKA